jgi:hypothetical protein
MILVRTDHPFLRVGRHTARLSRPVWGRESLGCHGRCGEGSRRAATAGGGVGRGVTGLPRPAWGREPPGCRGQWRRGEGSRRAAAAGVGSGAAELSWPVWGGVPRLRGEKRRKEVLGWEKWMKKWTGISITDDNTGNFCELGCHQRGKKQVQCHCRVFLVLNMKTQSAFRKAAGRRPSLVQLRHLERKSWPPMLNQTQP